ncbi:helix-turn-helix domain-containing protein [Olegusella massiliensis]|uniref:helix-turn-helix domain-containing protein n=1 Tax=Olegusella massiliensis TaxID=1776381 RepID=UPI00405563E8
MSFSYKKLWKLLIDNDMMKKDLMEKAKVTSSTMARLGKDKPVSMDALARICCVLDCNIGDIVDIVKD